MFFVFVLSRNGCVGVGGCGVVYSVVVFLLVVLVVVLLLWRW